MILRARTVLPVSRPPIENGAVLLIDNRIHAVGPWLDFQAQEGDEIFDLGEVILLPGLINAHCHLDYTDMAGQLPPPRTFTDWIPLITAAKTAWSYSDYARSWLHGANMLLRNGTTTVADIEAMPDLLPDLWDATPLRVFSFLEMTGIRARREPEEILREAVEKIDSLSHARCSASVSPHAPYSTLPELLRGSARLARARHWPLCTHVAESEQEFEMFTHARGAMYDWLQRNHRDNSDCGRGTPVEHLARNNMLSKNLIAIHANLLVPGDVTLLGKHGVNIVHCPGSHDYFCHPEFQREQLAAAGANLCLGTDSLATVRIVEKQTPELNMFREMQTLAARDKTVSPLEILQMATVNGACALGMKGRIGELTPGALADLITIPATGDGTDIYETVLHHAGPVHASVIGGRWVHPSH
jgi:cytosine/adenosine deaminase-related metal-dependent hydrolase